MQLQVKKADQVVVWKFEVEDYDVEFTIEYQEYSARYRTNVVHAPTRYNAFINYTCYDFITY